MNQPYLVIKPDAYELWLDEKLLTRLAGGSASLLAGAGPQLREIDIEAAIERAEEWLMPFSKWLEGLQLTVRDSTNRVHGHFGDREHCSLAQVEQAFTDVHYAVARMRTNDRDGVADIVLLRELAHHGRLAGITLEIADPQPHGGLASL